MKTKQIIFIFAAFYCSNIFAQPSAYVSNNNIKASANTIDSLNEVACKLKQHNVSGALNILIVSSSLANQSNYKKGLAKAYFYEAEIFDECSFDKQASDLYNKSLKLSKALNDTFYIAKTAEKIALNLLQKGKPDSAELLLQQVLFYYEKLNNTNKIIETKINLSTVKLQQKNFIQANKFIADALHMSDSVNYQQGKINALFNSGFLNASTNNLTKADSIFKAVAIMDSAANNKISLAKTYLQLSAIKKQENKYNISAGYALTAYHFSAIINNIELQQQAAKQLVDISTLIDDEKNSRRWHDSLVQLKEKQYQLIKTYAFDFINVLQNRVIRTADTQNQILSDENSSNKQSIYLIIFSALFITFTIIAIPVYINYRKTKVLSKELSEKNAVTQKNASSLEQLNTAISRQNKKLEEENRMKDKLLSIISHDLRHPLVNTKSILDLINSKLINPAETEELLEQLEHQYVRSLNLLDNLLFWIRGQMKGIKIEKTQVNVYQLLNLLIEEQRLSIQTKNLQVKNYADANLDLLAEKEMLRIIFRNLLNNAIKFTQQHGEISLSSVIKDGFAYIIVKDTGIGMSAEVLEKINMQGYFTSKGTFNEKGSGFGLILVRDLIAKHRGELLIESRAGKGSTFAVKLPVQIKRSERFYSSALSAENI